MNSIFVHCRPKALTALLLCGVLLSVGCGPSGPTLVPVKGKLTVNGQPYDPKTQEEVMVILHPTDGTGTTFPAVFADDGSFFVPGVEQRGVPPGKYKIALDRYENPDKQPVLVPPAYRGANTKMERDIQPDKGDLGAIEVMTPP
jgi:hypothetical protein